MCFTLSLLCLTLIMHFNGPWTDIVKVAIVISLEVLMMAFGAVMKLLKREKLAKYGVLVELIIITVPLFVQ